MTKLIVVEQDKKTGVITEREETTYSFNEMMVHEERIYKERNPKALIEIRLERDNGKIIRQYKAVD